MSLHNILSKWCLTLCGMGVLHCYAMRLFDLRVVQTCLDQVFQASTEASHCKTMTLWMSGHHLYRGSFIDSQSNKIDNRSAKWGRFHCLRPMDTTNVFIDLVGYMMVNDGRLHEGVVSFLMAQPAICFGTYISCMMLSLCNIILHTGNLSSGQNVSSEHFC